MKPMGRTHRPFYRIVAIDGRQPNDGRDLEILGTYDPFAPNPDNSVTLKPSRIKYWQSVGARVSDKVEAILKKHLGKFEEIEAAAKAEAKPAEPAKS
jgi:small subunit ribosomal protein S16